MTLTYFEDISVGDKTSYGSKLVTREEMLDFSRKYDPQSFHIDDQAAEQSLYGGLIASGWHTAAMLMRMLVDSTGNKRAGLGSPGFDDLRWIKPVRAGDILRFESTIFETRKSVSRPDMGVVRSEVCVFNQDNEIVLSLKSTGMIKTRPE